MESPYECEFDYYYARPKTVVFPTPPPTTNDLSPDERARLVRSSKKIARVLGATPRFVDSESENYTRMPSTRKPPMLRLETSLETIPASPRTPTLTPAPVPSKSRTLTTRHRRSPPLDGSLSSSPYKAEADSPLSSPTESLFVIPSQATTRRRKMDRLRRLLGEDVPVGLVFPRPSGSDSESGSEPSLTSSGGTSSEEDLSTPNTSPLSPTSPLLDVDFHAEEKTSPHVPHTPPRKKKITNARDSLVLPSSPSKSPRTSQNFVAPQASRPAPPPPAPSPSTSPKKKSTSNLMFAQRKPVLAPYKAPIPVAPISPRIYEHPPVVHRRSHSGGSTHTRLGLGVILEEKVESEWYGDHDCEEDFDFIQEDEVLGAVSGWGNGSAFLYGGPVCKGMGRGLARSYGSGAVGGYSRS
ncbi:hypothetical protein DXG01_015484 [Tephrocybe rancida]|nr:hypothetical protein DXG01_015484 [Tephrocybe rancida]